MASVNSVLLSNKDSENENGSKHSHHLSLLTIKGNTSAPGMMSALSSTRHSASDLNAASFVASTPAPSNNCHGHNNDMTNVSDSTSYVPFCPHDELQTSTQIENIDSEKEQAYNELRSCYRNANKINSLSETPSRFQIPSAEKAVFLLDNSHKSQLRKVRPDMMFILQLHIFYTPPHRLLPP